MEYKECGTCNQRRNISEFYTHPQYAYCGGSAPTCRTCTNAKRRKTRDYLLDVARNKRYLKKHTERRLYYSCKARAKQLGLEFNLELTDIVIPVYCPYLKQPLTNLFAEAGAKTAWYNPSVDRIDPSQGYVKGNIEVISRKANVMKNNASVEELLLFAEAVKGRLVSGKYTR